MPDRHSPRMLCLYIRYQAPIDAALGAAVWLGLLAILIFTEASCVTT